SPTPRRDRACGSAAREDRAAPHGRATRGVRGRSERRCRAPANSKGSLTIAQPDVAAHGLQAHVPRTVAPRPLQRVSGSVMALDRRRAEAVGDVAGETPGLVAVTIIGARPHVEVAAHRGRIEIGAARELALE